MKEIINYLHNWFVLLVRVNIAFDILKGEFNKKVTERKERRGRKTCHCLTRKVLALHTITLPLDLYAPWLPLDSLDPQTHRLSHFSYYPFHILPPLSADSSPSQPGKSFSAQSKCLLLQQLSPDPQGWGISPPLGIPPSHTSPVPLGPHSIISHLRDTCSI